MDIDPYIFCSLAALLYPFDNPLQCASRTLDSQGLISDGMIWETGSKRSAEPYHQSSSPFEEVGTAQHVQEKLNYMKDWLFIYTILCLVGGGGDSTHTR